LKSRTERLGDELTETNLPHLSCELVHGGAQAIRNRAKRNYNLNDEL
jgi:hypothetical protein